MATRSSGRRPMPDVGDRVRVASVKVGQVARDGEVTAVLGPLLRIRWSTGEESTIVPGPGSVAVSGRGGPAADEPALEAPDSTTTTSAGKLEMERAPRRRAPRRRAPRRRAPRRRAPRRSHGRCAPPMLGGPSGVIATQVVRHARFNNWVGWRPERPGPPVADRISLAS